MSRQSRTAEAIDAYVDQILGDAPPISFATAGRVMDMLNAVRRPTKMSAQEKRAVSAKEAADLKLAEKNRAERRATACAVCGVPKVGHYYNDSHHSWEAQK